MLVGKWIFISHEGDEGVCSIGSVVGTPEPGYLLVRLRPVDKGTPVTVQRLLALSDLVSESVLFFDTEDQVLEFMRWAESDEGDDQEPVAKPN